MCLVKEAPAKINLMLNVIGKRQDGMHDVDMIMTSLELHDTLTFRARTDTELRVTSDVFLGCMEDNLVYKAALKLQKIYNIKAGADIHIEKKIPVGAGLAGGSSDCAATLRGLIELWNLSIDAETLEEIASSLGADVPYCLYNKTARVQGFGEQLTFLKSFPHFYVLLVKPSFSVSTAEAYAQVQTDDALSPQAISNFVDAYEYGEILLLQNSFERSAFEQYPELQVIKDKLLTVSRSVVLSGSGPTLYLLAENKEDINDAAKIFTDTEYTVIKTEIKNEK